MAQATKKDPVLEAQIRNITGVDRRAAIENNRCVPAPIGCGQPVKFPKGFCDDNSLREYQISGLCQRCQDKVFGRGKDQRRAACRKLRCRKPTCEDCEHSFFTMKWPPHNPEAGLIVVSLDMIRSEDITWHFHSPEEEKKPWLEPRNGPCDYITPCGRHDHPNWPERNPVPEWLRHRGDYRGYFFWLDEMNEAGYQYGEPDAVWCCCYSNGRCRTTAPAIFPGPSCAEHNKGMRMIRRERATWTDPRSDSPPYVHCRVCGADENNRWIAEVDRPKRVEAGLCDHCYYWQRWHDEHYNKPDDHLVVKGNAYAICPDNSDDRSFSGFAGAEFRIKFREGHPRAGEIVITHNLWHNGEIPEEHFRKLMPDNADFVQ